jgi:hypothetical protein
LMATTTPDALGKVVDLDRAAETIKSKPAQHQLETPEWDWDRVENERLRGLELAKGWLTLDAELLLEFSRVPGN